MLTHNGETLSMQELAYRHGLTPQRLCQRLHDGWSLERALCTPLKPYRTIGQAISAYLEKQEETP